MAYLNLNVVRIEELEPITLPQIDSSNILWGVLETDSRVYKFDIKETILHLPCKDPRVEPLINRVGALENRVANLELGIDENVVIEP